jgi:hypothetical protein
MMVSQNLTRAQGRRPQWMSASLIQWWDMMRGNLWATPGGSDAIVKSKVLKDEKPT